MNRILGRGRHRMQSSGMVWNIDLDTETDIWEIPANSDAGKGRVNYP